ncbi:pectin lyase fold/virulence factor [Xylogone sp. PMI_703]|nr:pectin lyase fold/virulence factor [Xylogone sp. PMI_703]
MKLSFALWLATGGLSALAADFYVSPHGSDKSAGSKGKPFNTLHRAQEAVRAVVAAGPLSEDINVHLNAGTYVLSEPLRFEAADSGQNGFTVNWIGSGATVSGGLKVDKWKLESNGIYVAAVPPGTQSRNLYVGGKAANYARRRLDNRDDFNYTSIGMSWSNATYDWLMTTPGIEDAEVRFIASFTDRYSPIQSVGDRELVMKQDIWANQIIGWDTVVSPFANFGVFVQNCRALLTDGGEFCLDSKAGKVYYKPLDGEDMRKIDAYLGIQEVVLSIGGTYDTPVHDITFKGIEFAHSTWLRPRTYGYIDQQTSGYIGENVTYPEFEASRPRWWQLPSAIQISAANNITMVDCTYTQLGAGGIGIGNDDNAHLTNLGLGASHISIIDGYFTQIMGGSILAGGIQQNAHHPSDPRMTNSHITISGNIFYNNSALFSSTVNILTTYVQYSTVSHNDIYMATYSGISHGYGWGANDAGGSLDYLKRGLYKYQPIFSTPTTSKNNTIEGNLIHGYGTTHTDLGGVYTLSESPGTLVINNYMYDSAYKGLHPDEGTANITYINNLCFNDALWYDPNDSDPTYRTGNNTLLDNWGKNKNPKYPLDGYPNHTGPHNNTFLRNHIVPDVTQTSARAQRAAYRSGILPARRAGRPVSNNVTLADGFLAIESRNQLVEIRVDNFDDVTYTGVSLQVRAADVGHGHKYELESIKVPKSIPANSFAVATYQLRGKTNGQVNVTVTATASYKNPRTGRKGLLSTSGNIRLGG